MSTVIITISDIGTWTRYELRGRDLKMVQSGGCVDALAMQRCDISSRMDDEKIIRRVYDAWAIGYDGDPDDARVRVTVRRTS